MVIRNNTPQLLSLGMLIKEDSQDENPVSMQTMLHTNMVFGFIAE